MATNQATEEAYYKLSASDFPPFLVSAPGKVIVYGEHAVVYGKVCKAQSAGEIGKLLGLRNGKEM